MNTEGIITLIVAIFASTGFWTFLSQLVERKSKFRNSIEQAILGVLRTLIIDEGKRYCEQGYISFNDKKDFDEYLVKPYRAFHGNGGGEAMIKRVDALDVKDE